jgi:SPP1 gp7 family putative phage head morphogenesis protein
MAGSRRKFPTPESTIKSSGVALDPVLETESVGASALGRSETEFLKMFMHHAPEAFRMDVAPTQMAHAAYGLIYIRDPFLYDLYDEMVDKDPALQSCISYLVGRVSAYELRFEAADESDEAAAIRDACEDDLTGVEGAYNWRMMIQNAVSGAVQSGFSAHEILWRNDAGVGRIVPSAYIHRHPGQFSFDALGRPLLWQGFASKDAPRYTDTFDLFDLKFSIARMPSRYGSAYGRSTLHGLRWLWHFKRLIQKSYFAAIKQYGTPLALGKVNENGPGNMMNLQDTIDDLASKIEDLSELHGMVLKPDQALEFVARGATRGLPHGEAISWCDNQMMRVLLGSTLHVAEAEFGTRSQADTHLSVSDQHINPIAKIVQDMLNSGPVRAWSRMNLARPELAPRIVIDTESQQGVEEAIKIVRAAGELALDMPKRQAREWLGIESLEEGEAPVNHPAFGGGGTGNGDDAQLFGVKKNGSRVEFASRKSARTRAIVAVSRNEQIAAIQSTSSRVAAIDALKRMIKAVRKYGGDTESPMPEVLKSYALAKPEFDEAEFERLIFAARALALLDLAAQIPTAEKSFVKFDDEDDQGAGNYSDAIDWMEEQSIVSQIGRGKIVSAIRALDPHYDSRIARESVGRSAKRISDFISERATGELEASLVDAVTRGESIGNFLSRMDKLAEKELLPGGTDAYFENVFRTETASAYSAMTREALSDSQVADFVWGVELINPDDDRSRHSHAAINGLLLKKGSRAYNSRPTPPYSYQCRCVEIPVLMGDPDSSDLEEPPDALDLVQGIEGF